MVVTEVVDGVTAPSADERAAVLASPIEVGSYLRAFERFGCLHALEVAPSSAPAPGPAAARIVFWNAERLKYPGPSAAMLASAQADVLLLCEVDVGMARTGNRHTVADLAQQLGTGYAFGVEFVELGLGDARERAWHAGQHNEDGLHGGAILSRQSLERAALVRLERSGRWFDGRFGERRVGGRMAMMAEVRIGGRAVLVAAVHYESHSDPADRLVLTQTLLDAVDRHAPDTPVLIAGDFNTNTFALADKEHREHDAAALRLDPQRLLAPMRYEPMFAALQERGYDWEDCNLPLAATQRSRPDGTPSPPFGKIDWLFARGLRCTEPQIIPAVDAAGIAISDHEALAVTVTPA